MCLTIMQSPVSLSSHYYAKSPDVEMDQLATANDHASDPTGDLDFIQAALRREHHARLESRGRSDIVRLLWRSVWDNHRSLRCQ